MKIYMNVRCLVVLVKRTLIYIHRSDYNVGSITTNQIWNEWFRICFYLPHIFHSHFHLVGLQLNRQWLKMRFVDGYLVVLKLRQRLFACSSVFSYFILLFLSFSLALYLSLFRKYMIVSYMTDTRACQYNRNLDVKICTWIVMMLKGPNTKYWTHLILVGL